jgi:5-methylcytosine-specific restriction endonuclease McrA
VNDWSEQDRLAREQRKIAAQGDAKMQSLYGPSRESLTERWKRQDRARLSEQTFYDSPAWLRLRYQALKRRNACCDCCGARGSYSNPLQIDHIKPRSKYPDLQLEISNLQILCRDCNMGKGAWDETDWRCR